MRSVNGWPVLTTNRTTGDLPRLRRWVLPIRGEDRHLFLRDGAAGFLLVHFAVWWHDKIERLDVGVWDEWGWAVRPVRGQTTGYSNHASGTAADLNATRHPIGVPVARTFTPRQVRAIKRRLRLYGGLLTWGGEWSRPDGMHVELSTGSTLPAAERRARLLLNSPRGRRITRANPGARKVVQS